MPVAIPLAIAGASVAGAAISSSASRSAANTVSQSTDRAADLQNQQFQQLLALQMPAYRRAEGASGTYMQALGLGGPQTQPPPQGPQPGGYGGGGMTGGGLVPGRGGFQGGGGLPGRRADQRLMTGGKPNGAQFMPGGEDYTGPQYQGEDFSGPQVYNGGAAVPGGPQTLPGQPGAGNQGALDIGEQVRNTPGYQEQLRAGTTAIDRAAPLVGGMYSGRRMKALNDHGQQTFGGYYNDWLNRVGGIAGQAPQIASSIGQAGQQNANNVGNLWMTGANARAQGQTNSASAWTGALGNIAGIAGGYFK
jgi:hypothetical protein